MVINRCRCYTNNNTVCKRKGTFLINNKKYCNQHMNILYSSYVNIIIKIFKGYYIRKKLFYYKQLPCDVQYKIIYKMRENFYIDHYNCSVSKIIYNKIKSFNKKIIDASITETYLVDLFIRSLFYEINFDDTFNLNLTDEILYLYKLLNKYKLIINTNTSKTKELLYYLIFCASCIKKYHVAIEEFNFGNFRENLNIIKTFNTYYNS